MEGEERDRGFKVKDRRRFSADGEAREEQDSTAAEPTAASPQSAPSQAPSSPAHEHAHAHEHDHDHDHEHAHDHDHPHAEITFATFIISLSAQALALLGEMPDPVSRSTQIDLEGARQIIDILGILGEKTRGNLDAAESSLLDNALFDLRMKYVDRAQGR